MQPIRLQLKTKVSQGEIVVILKTDEKEKLYDNGVIEEEPEEGIVEEKTESKLEGMYQ